MGLIMAAKLKKRALAEYNSQVVHVDPQLQEKRLKITGGDSRYEYYWTGQLPTLITYLFALPADFSE